MARNYLIPNRKLGIIGGGQLARMLALEAIPLGLQVHILCEKQSEPAAQIAHSWQSGNPQSHKDVAEFTKHLDLLSFESEFFSMQDFKTAEANGTYVFPRPSAMENLQDRERQKILLDKCKIKTAKWMLVETKDDLNKAAVAFENAFVLKKCQGGYDGNGTFYCKSANDLKKLGSLMPGRFIAEELIAFTRELAISLVRSKNGSLVALPLVETKQKDSRCDWVSGPKQHPGIAAFIKQAKHLLAKIDYVGSIAFEIFETNKQLLVNEIAPRVHNSAHYSQNALSESQFLLHLKAGLGFPLAEPLLLAPAFAMVNLIGSRLEPALIPTEWVGALHWYGKTENRKGRKMGHLNFLGKTQSALLKKALQERERFKI